MSMEGHALPRDQFIALAAGGGGAEAIRSLVAAEHSRHVTLLRGVRKQAQLAGHPGDRLALAGYELLVQVQRANPGAAEAVIRYPSFAVWALRTLRGDQSVPGTRPGGLALVAAAAAIRAGIAAEIAVPVIGGKVVLPSLGVAEAGGSEAIVATGPGEVRSGAGCVPLRPGTPGWQELRPVQAGSLGVLIDDVDPYRMLATDGEPTGRLTSSEVADVEAYLRGAWEVLDPASAAEIAAIVQVIVPYQAPSGGLVSTSSPEAFGTIAMSRPPDRYTCAEILVHETAHLKLCALLELVRLTGPDNGQLYYAPWRDDPRPAAPLLQGAYAFMAVGGFWRRQRHAAVEHDVRQRADAEFAWSRESAAGAVDALLASGQLTPEGQDFVTEMARVLEGWQAEPVPADALAVAQRKASQHRDQWDASNGPDPAMTAAAAAG